MQTRAAAKRALAQAAEETSKPLTEEEAPEPMMIEAWDHHHGHDGSMDQSEGIAVKPPKFNPIPVERSFDSLFYGSLSTLSSLSSGGGSFSSIDDAPTRNSSLASFTPSQQAAGGLLSFVAKNNNAEAAPATPNNARVGPNRVARGMPKRRTHNRPYPVAGALTGSSSTDSLMASPSPVKRSIPARELAAQFNSSTPARELAAQASSSTPARDLAAQWKSSTSTPARDLFAEFTKSLASREPAAVWNSDPVVGASPAVNNDMVIDSLSLPASPSKLEGPRVFGKMGERDHDTIFKNEWARLMHKREEDQAVLMASMSPTKKGKGRKGKKVDRRRVVAAPATREPTPTPASAAPPPSGRRKLSSEGTELIDETWRPPHRETLFEYPQIWVANPSNGLQSHPTLPAL